MKPRGNGVNDDHEQVGLELTVPTRPTDASHQPPDPRPTNRNVAEFFAGIGLVRLALERRGWSVVFANDNDLKKATIYRANFGTAHHSLADIRDVTASDVPDCTLYTASFPCNDLSIAGAMAGLNGRHSSMFWEFLRIVREKGPRKPPLILLENVVGFLTSRGGKDFEAALLALNELGYCVDAIILNASRFVPQSRVRLFVIAKLRPSRPSAPARECSARPAALIQFIRSHPNIHWDIRPLPEPPTSELRLVDILEDLPPYHHLWWDDARAARFIEQLSDRHVTVAEQMIAAPWYSYATAFRRGRNGIATAELRTDGFAGCLRTPRGGSARQILFKAGRDHYWVRLLSARECARLQGANDTFKIDVPFNSALFGFGDAVCVPVIEWIAEHYLAPVANELLVGRSIRQLEAGSRRPPVLSSCDP